MLNAFSYYFLIIFFVVGLVIGSFLNVLILRVNDLKTVIADRSHCPKCKHVLSWQDLIPLFSFILLHAKCRYCHKKISWQYPVVELITGLLFSFLYLNFYNNILELLFYLMVFSILLVVVVHDIKTQTIPGAFVYSAIILSLIGSWHFDLGFKNMIIGGLIGGGIPALLVIISKEKWMGAGDIEVGLVLGLILGYPLALFGFFFACLLGSIIGIFFMAQKKKTMTDSLPFAPYLIASTLMSLVWGERIMAWYFNSLI